MLRQLLIGRSGLRTSELALGTMNFGEPRKWGVDPDEARRILERFVEAGGTTIDTAPNYAGGKSEEIVGEFARGRREELVISTKFTAANSSHPLAGGNSRRSMVQSVDASLRRLGTDRIDLLWLHFWDFTTPVDEILRAVDDLTRAGKILYFGLSDTPAWIASRAVTMAEMARSAPVIALQLEYNLGSREVEHELLPLAKACDLGVFCWGPLAAGALAAGDAPQRRKPDAIPSELAGVVREVASIAEQCGRSARSVALRWIMQSDRASCVPLLGARSQAQIDALLHELGDPLGPEILDRLSQIAPPIPIFPHRLIESAYLRKFALGDPSAITLPNGTRA